MRKVVLAVGVLASATFALPTLAPADHRPNHEGGGPGAKLTIAATPDPVQFPRVVTITGRLIGSENEGKTVELQERPYPFNTAFAPSAISPTTTRAQGEYTFRIRPRTLTDYRVVAKVDPEIVSDTVRVRVRMSISRRVSDRTPAAGQRVVFSGFVGPAHDGRRVYIQRRNSEGVWRTKARTRLVDAGDSRPLYSEYSRGVRVGRDGVYRVLVRGDLDHIGNHSRRVRLDVP